MFVQVKPLLYWKSEHNEETCEDACGWDCQRGLFAIADGAGATLFAGTWARLLVQQFVDLPLLSVDPFEVEWWLTLAQERYRQTLPAPPALSWHASSKMQDERSHAQATLAALRIQEQHPEHIVASMLAIGDSCVLIRRRDSGELETFPLQGESAFGHVPLCLPSRPALFARTFHRLAAQTAVLRAGDCLMLATDAIARWIIGGAGGRCSPAAVFDGVARQTAHSWPRFVGICRRRYGLLDDDSTVLLLRFADTAEAETCELGVTQEHPLECLQERRAAFEQARLQQDRRRMAVLYGDGVDLQRSGLVLSAAEIAAARQVAAALEELLTRLRPLLNSPDPAALAAELWRQYAPLLAREPCAAPLRQTLARLGVSLESPAAKPETAAAVTDEEEPGREETARRAEASLPECAPQEEL